MFSPLSFSMDNGTYACVVTLTPICPEFVNVNMGLGSLALAVRGEVREHEEGDRPIICISKNYDFNLSCLIT